MILRLIARIHLVIVLENRRGRVKSPGASSRAGIFGARKHWARNPLPGRSSWSERWFFAEAWKNQAAFGSAGRRGVVPCRPSEKPNGSFQKPKPHVPGRGEPETRQRRLRLAGAFSGKRPRGSAE